MLPPAVECDLGEVASVLLGPQADENCKAAAVSLLRASAENFAEWLGEKVSSDFETRLSVLHVNVLTFFPPGAGQLGPLPSPSRDSKHSVPTVSAFKKRGARSAPAPVPAPERDEGHFSRPQREHVLLVLDKGGLIVLYGTPQATFAAK